MCVSRKVRVIQLAPTGQSPFLREVNVANLGVEWESLKWHSLAFEQFGRKLAPLTLTFLQI